MRRSEAEDAGGLTPVKDDNEAAPHFPRRTLLVFNCFDYIIRRHCQGYYVIGQCDLSCHGRQRLACAIGKKRLASDHTALQHLQDRLKQYKAVAYHHGII